ncbi:hypothetical protein Pyn_06406 [Prunus yedoensis var. nudiflora]|uniref:Uncharacterized protein n=1 Tax=Prunus yedoensis var. nudiflora TaxID=2094558 RepID=A0A314YYJ4_PRUYE|nr:hypothetical protein Pyn_06406 [Prunus yedoensis var. nudiflora]
MPQQPEKKKPAAMRSMTNPAGTRIGLNSTRTGVAMIRAITVPVRVNPDRNNSVAPTVAAVKSLTVWCQGGADRP